MESRKYQLQKQITDALKANDKDLYSLLKSQWAHRFGVESLEELKNLEINMENLSPQKEHNQNVDESEDYFTKVDKEISIKDKNDKETEIKNEIKQLVKSAQLDKKESFEIKSHEIVDKENLDRKTTDSIKVNKNHPKVEALIPLPPKPKYNYLRKWLL